MARQYNGYPSWNSWNVSLWINNDYELYRTAYDAVQNNGMTRAVNILTAYWYKKKTPDGGVYSEPDFKIDVYKETRVPDEKVEV